MHRLVQFLKPTLLVTVAVLAPIYSIMLATGCLIFIDLGTGIWRAIKAKEKITSYGLRRTIGKIIAYNLAIISGYIIETFLLGGIPVLKIISGVIAVTEGKSILENLTTITGIDFIKVFLDKVQGLKNTPK